MIGVAFPGWMYIRRIQSCCRKIIRNIFAGCAKLDEKLYLHKFCIISISVSCFACAKHLRQSVEHYKRLKKILETLKVHVPILNPLYSLDDTSFFTFFSKIPLCSIYVCMFIWKNIQTEKLFYIFSLPSTWILNWLLKHVLPKNSYSEKNIILVPNP